MDLDRFARWLVEEQELSKRSAKDVCSRLKRAARWVEFEEGADPELLIFLLEKAEPFRCLSPSVRSQLRGALRRYEEFLRATKDG